MTDTQVSVFLPVSSADLAQRLQNLFLNVLSAKKSGANGLALVTEAVGASIIDLAPALGDIAALGSEAGLEPVGVAEAFALAGFNVARALTGK